LGWGRDLLDRQELACAHDSVRKPSSAFLTGSAGGAAARTLREQAPAPLPRRKPPIPLVSAIGPDVNYASARSGGEPCMLTGTSCGVLAVRAKQAMETGTSAPDKIAALLEFIADGLTNDPPKVRFVLQFDAMYARHRPVERLLWLETRISTQGFESFSALIREGLTDGSPRPDLDPALTMHAVINAVIGTQRRLASLGDRVELEYGKPIDVLFREMIRIILLGLRASGPPVAPRIRKRSQPKRKRHS